METPSPSGRLPGTWRNVLVALVLTVVVTSAGCAGIGDVGESAGPETQTAATTTDGPTGTSSDSHSHSHGDSHSHSHSHGNSDGDSSVATTSEGPTGTSSEEPTGTSSDATATGEMTVVVAGVEVTGDATVDGDRIRFDDEQPHTWHADGDVPLARALSVLGVEVAGDTVTYDGTTYDADADGTSIHARVDGAPVDPSTYVLSDGDQVWVTVETADMNVSTPGEYISRDDQHVHGPMEVLVGGEEVDFERDRYQTNDRYFHFEGGDGTEWHAHSYSITLQYALSSLDGITVSADGRTVTFDGTTYREGESGSTITFEVNGERVVPGEYYLKDGDGIRVVIEDSP